MYAVKNIRCKLGSYRARRTCSCGEQRSRGLGRHHWSVCERREKIKLLPPSNVQPVPPKNQPF